MTQNLSDMSHSTFEIGAVAHNEDFKTQRRDGNENVAKKVNLRSLSLYHNYSYPLTLSNVGEPSWSWIPRHHIQVQ